MRKLLSLCLLWLAIGAQAQQQQPEDFSAARKLQIAEFAIQQLYVDPVNEDKIVESAIIEMLRQLDPHSTYANAEEVKRLNEPLEGNFEGIGIQFNMNEDTLMVIQVIPDGPSEKAGLLPGDRIISVNDTDKRQLPLMAVRLVELGFSIWATEGTASVLRRYGID